MRKVLVLILVVGIFLTFADKGECRRNMKNLYNMFYEKDAVKVYVPDIINSSENGNPDLKGLKKTLEDALVTRMTINFKLVPVKKDADIFITCDVTEFLWTDKDPIDNISGIGPIAMDALMKENYARMQAVFTVMDAKNNKELWRKRLKATITNKTMTEQDSISMVNERIVKVFMRDCFSKTHGRR